jgi:hypothetical protein
LVARDRAVPKAFLNRVLHEHRYVLRDARLAIATGLAVNRFVDFACIAAIRVLPRELVGYPIKVLLEDLTAKFLAYRHERCSRVWGVPGVEAGERRALGKRKALEP